MEQNSKNIPDRVTRLEQQVEGMQRDITEIKEEVKLSATKSDLIVLRNWLEERDKQFTNNMWKVIYGLIILLGGLVVTMFAVKELPKIFM